MGAVVEATVISPDDGVGRPRIEWLADLSTAWDRRGGRERDQADPATISPELARAMHDAAESLGQSGRDVPAGRRYDAVLMTAGMVRAQVVKPRFVAELLDGGLEVDEVVFLGAFRPFSVEERGIGARLGHRATDEFDSMVEGMARRFGPFGHPTIEEQGDGDPVTWRDLSWRRGTTRFRVIAAPASSGSGRANTADTFRFWAGRRSPAITSVLAVTTPIYVPYQAAVAADVLGRQAGLAVETVGATRTSLDLGDLSQPFLAQHHLQELRSAILAMRSLRSALSTRS